ncbi:MAG: enoyl-CoA hydratase/isomerase family protein [Algicola sp.]|nr:enoyl-CoA hydratase/isomerase family protein [Algicola sp.]
MTDNQVLTTIDSRGVAHLTLNRPEVHNAFDDIVIGQLIAALNELDANADVRVLVLNSNGKNFSAGADLNWMRSMATKNLEQNLEDAGQLAELMRRLDKFSKPTIALVQGAAFGGALGLIACCDISIATKKASFCLSEVKIGLIPAAISPYVMRSIGEKAARRYFLTAERFFAEQAHHIGLIDILVEQNENLVEACESQLDLLLGNSPAAMTAAKLLIEAVAEKEINEAVIKDTSRRIAEIRVSPEGQEGLTSFLNKRTPNWIKA